MIKEILDGKDDDEIGLNPFGSDSDTDPSDSDSSSSSSDSSDYVDLTHSSASDIEIVCDEVFLR